MHILLNVVILAAVLLTMAGAAGGQKQSTSLWNSIGNALASYVLQDAAEIDDWLDNIKNKVIETLDAVDDAIDISMEQVGVVNWEGAKPTEYLTNTERWDFVKNLTSTFSNINLNFMREKLPSWTKFVSTNKNQENLVEVDAESQKLDELESQIHSYHSYQESKQANSRLPPECFMTTPQLIRYAGYPCSIYTTTTKDGYRLTLHRILFGKKDSKSRKNDFTTRGKRIQRNKDRPVVFLQHGILADSSTWCSSGSDRSLAFILADEGFDVWMGNSRGNLYSRTHVDLNPDTDERYWRFTWQQMSEYDLPAMVDAVLKTTRQNKLYYIGHSQGTLTAFARLAEDPSFNEKIHLMVALGPVSTLGHITSPIRSLASLKDVVQFGISVMGGAEILPRTELSTWLTTKLHKITSEDQLAYHGSNLLLFLVGFNVYHYHRDRLPVMLAHTPSGTSMHNLIHMAQMVSSGKMQKWDHLTFEDNLKVYGQEKPPEYEVSKISAPVALFVGAEDKLADPVDAGHLMAKLKNVHYYDILKDWDHLDFMWGERAPDMLYTKIIKLIRNFELKRRKLSDEL